MAIVEQCGLCFGSHSPLECPRHAEKEERSRQWRLNRLAILRYLRWCESTLGWASETSANQRSNPNKQQENR
jgi:hypothetical protein